MKRLLLGVAVAMVTACSGNTVSSRPGSSAPTSETAPASADTPTRLYWAEGPTGTASEPGSIASGSGTEVVHGLITGTSGGGGVAVDDQHIYWANHETGTIGRADFDGSHVDQRFITGAEDPVGIAVDDRYVYWTNSVFSKEDNDFETTVGRARLDGSDVDQRYIVATRGETHSVAGLAVDGNYLYWADSTADRIGRAAMDGTDVTADFITAANVPTGVTVNAAFVYWSNGGDNSIGRSRLDGTDPNPRCIVPTDGPIGNAPEGVATDGQHVYWSNYPGNALSRANPDGSGVVERFIVATGVPEGVAVRPQRLAVASTDGSCVQSPEPTLLGVKPANLPPDSLGPYATGWGQVAPPTLSNGGASASGTISDIVWSRWGGPTAQGQGTNPIFMPQGGYYDQPAAIQLRLSNIRRCSTGGPLSYTTLETREPDVPGGDFGPWQTAAADLCQGEGI